MGAGKSTVADAVSDLLRAADVAHGVVDLDAFTGCYPAPPDDPYRSRVALQNLGAVWRNFQAAGARFLVVARVVESRSGLDAYRAAVPGAELTVVRLRASPELLAERIRRRGSDRDLVKAADRARELAGIMDGAAVEDILIEVADRAPADLAQDILDRLGWLRAGQREHGGRADAPAPVGVRPARHADLDAVRALFVELNEEHAAALPELWRLPDPPEPDDEDFSTSIVNERCFFAVAEQAGQIVGLVDASHHEPRHPSDPDRPWCRINNLAVRRDRRRRGIATLLVRAAEEWAARRGFRDVRLDAFEFNAGARALYERLGYATLSRGMHKPLAPT
jgi:ribosomal protein S18 acetylase RimI-like enzyme/broad-specificity NMP kinase